MTKQASNSPKETFKFASDAIECGAFKMARIFTGRLRELCHEATEEKEIAEISGMLAEIRGKMG